ncbi:ribosomal protein L14p/L23e-domain-containing protein [Russula dissimulans]|nr:ribosomal protein L14p/L23e-domain-containing protein [Russula dissimulans]
MIGLKGTLNVIDNSGALLVECINVLKNKVNNGWGSVGDEIVCVVKRARPIPPSAQAASGPSSSSGSSSSSSSAVSNALKVRRGDVRRAVIVRCRKPVRRPDGRWVRFDDNAAVLLNSKREMLGTRIGGVVSADLRMKGWGKIVSLAPKVRDRCLFLCPPRRHSGTDEECARLYDNFRQCRQRTIGALIDVNHRSRMSVPISGIGTLNRPPLTAT